MKIYTLDSSAHNWHNDVKFFQTILFHGEAVHHAGQVGFCSHLMGESLQFPMQIRANAFRLAEVFIPERSSNLVVSEDVKNRLLPYSSNIIFYEVSFCKLFYLPWDDQGAHVLPDRIQKLIDQGRPYEIFNMADNETRLSGNITKYYEVVCFNQYRIAEKLKTTHRFFKCNYIGAPVDGHLLDVSEEMFREFPITDAGNPIVRDDIFEILRPYINMKYFGIKEFSFDTGSEKYVSGQSKGYK